MEGEARAGEVAVKFTKDEALVLFAGFTGVKTSASTPWKHSPEGHDAERHLIAPGDG